LNTLPNCANPFAKSSSAKELAINLISEKSKITANQDFSAILKISFACCLDTSTSQKSFKLIVVIVVK